MKVIDLLNKIANGEKVPKAIMYDGDIWKYDELSNDYEMFDKSGDLYLFQEELNITRALNDEVEIIEEDKKDNFTGMKVYQDGKEVYSIYEEVPFKCKEDVEIEEDKKIEKVHDCFISTDNKEIQFLIDNINQLGNKVNEIIDKINEDK